jgi:serine/threonine protein kinase/TolB-like protein/Tfp pilus assembly protein PilF
MVSLSGSDRWRQLEALFSEASELKPDARAAFLELNCSGDAELKKEVEALLESADKPMDFLEKPVAEAARRMMAEKLKKTLAPEALFGHYRIISMLGAGGMGEVYLAEDVRLGRRVALKVLAPELTHDENGLKRFEQEARTVSAINHPNILTVYDFGQVDGLHFIASEFIEGSTLRERLVNGKLELNAALDIAMQIASALAAAHSSGLVHRDIKPDNVIVRSDGIVKVLDFGIAKLSATWKTDTASRKTATFSTQPGMVLGTARYMSPEQARGVDVDFRSDIFSWGAVFYEMVAGRCAFAGETTSDVLAEILKSNPPPLAEFVPEVPRDVERVIHKVMRKEREERYQTAKELLADLHDLKKEAEFQHQLQRSPQGGIPARVSDSSSAHMPGPGIRAGGIGKLDDRFGVPLGSSRTAKWAILAVLLAAAVFIGYRGLPKSSTPHVPPPAHSLAVLPFRNLKQDPETDFLGFSLADAVITKLGYINALTIRPSSSVDKYRNQVIDPQKVAAELNVDTLLTGSFIKEGDDLRITTQLIGVKLNKVIWEDAIDVKYDKLLTVQDHVSQQIIKGLELNLSPTEAENLKPENPINSMAYEYDLRGVDLYALNEFGAAIKMLEKSAAIEPNYAPTWAHLGRAYTTNASLEFGGREDYVKAQAAYEKAIALNPALTEPRIYMANLLTDTGRVEQAVPLLRSVLQSSPNSAEAHWELGYAYRFGGMLKESVAECEQARQNNPLVKINSAALNSYLYLGDYGKFIQSLPVNDSVYTLFYRGFVEYHLGNMDQAARDFDRAYEMEPSLLPANVGKALSYSIKHDNRSALELLRQTERKIEERGVSDAEGIYKVAQAYAVLGDKAAALHLLRHSIGGGFFCYPYFMRDPLLQSLRDQPEFKELMNQARQRHEQFKATLF